MSSQQSEDSDQRRRRQNRMAQRAHRKAVQKKLDRLAELESAAAGSPPSLARISSSNITGSSDMSADIMNFDFTSMGDLSQHNKPEQSAALVSIPLLPSTRFSPRETAPGDSMHNFIPQHLADTISNPINCVDCMRESLANAQTRTDATTFPQATTLPPTPSLTSVTPDQPLDLSLLVGPSTPAMSISSILIGNTAIHQACHNGHTDVVRLLLDRGASPGDTNGVGKTILHVACEKGHTNIVRMLLHRGLDLEQKDHAGMSPLYLAASNGHTDIVDILIDQGASAVTRCD